MTRTIRVKRPTDPLQPFIDARLATKRAAGKQEALNPVIAPTEAFRAPETMSDIAKHHGWVAAEQGGFA